MLSAFLLPATLYGQEAGYRTETGRVIIDAFEHFGAWSRANGTVELVSDGDTGLFAGARPARWRRDINALQGDIVADLRLNFPKRLQDAGTDPADLTILDAIDTGQSNSRAEVLKAFDDDLGTWWEPVFPAERSADIIGSESYFSIDLGRVVVADKIVLKFVGEEDGDPFLLFDVFTSDGQNPVSRPASIFGENPEYRRVYTTLGPNKNQREFEIDLSQFNSPADSHKRLVHFVRVVVTGSGFERGRQVTQEEYEDLRQVAPQDTGMVEYTRRLASGSLIEVKRGVWERLDAISQGPIRYWQREQPRLAEIQVWGEGEDILQRIQERCSEPSCVILSDQLAGPTFVGPQFMDGNLATKMQLGRDPGEVAYIQGFVRELFVDLSSTFWIESYRHTALSAFGPWLIEFSDGSVEPDGSLRWERVFRDEVGGDSQRLMSIDFDPVKARFMHLQWQVEGTGIDLSELQLMGDGYQPEVTMVSPAIELPGTSNMVSIEWEAETPPGTSVSIQTRTGTGLGIELCYYKTQAGQTTLIGCGAQGSAEAAAHENAYNNLRFGAKQAGIEENSFVDETKFSPWSEVYVDPDGSAITSPSPRPVLLVQATLVSDDPDTHATLKSVTLNFDEPVANRLLGSVQPTRVVALGVDQAFSLVVQLDTLQLGLDELLLLPPPGMELVREPLPVMYAGSLAQLEDGQDMSALTRDAAVLLPREGTAAGDSLHLSFAAIEGARAPEAIRLEFTGRLFSPGGRLRAQLRNSESAGGNWQRVDQELKSLVLLAQPEQKELFRDLALVPAAFSPNGDGANDEMRVSFTLLSVGVGTGVDVDVYDLSGRLVRHLHEERDNSTGAYAIPWDGRNDAGDLVAPGVYTVRVKLSGDTAGSGIDRLEELRTVAVVY